MPYVLHPRTSILRSLLLAVTLAVYDTNPNRRYYRNYKWHYEKMYNCVHLCVAVVRGHHDSFVFLRVEARENCSLISESLGENRAPDRRWIWKGITDGNGVQVNGKCQCHSHPHPLMFTWSTDSVVVFSISVVKLANSGIVALCGNVKLTLSPINSTNCTYMWVHLNTSDVQPSRHELHEQFSSPVKSSRLVVTHKVGRSMKSPASVDKAGSDEFFIWKVESWFSSGNGNRNKKNLISRKMFWFREKSFLKGNIKSFSSLPT